MSEAVKIRPKKLRAGCQSLKDWCDENGKWGERLLKEWDTERNLNEYGYTPDNMGSQSPKGVWWICITCQNTWNARIENRTTYKHSCPDCYGTKITTEKNNLTTWCNKNGDYGKKLLNEWDYEENLDKLKKTPDTIRWGSNLSVWWKCQDCNYEWEAMLYNRTAHKSGCPSCSGKVVTGKNSLSTWCKNNGEWGQRLLNEWDAEKNLKELSATPDITAKGSGKEAYWKCQDCGYEWTATVHDRTAKRCGCPNCNHTSTSYAEQFIYWALKQIWPDTENRVRVLKSKENPQGIEFDVCIPDIPLCIEYSPTYWHTGREDRNASKAEACRQYNVNYLLIVEDDFNELEEAFTPNYICIKPSYSNQDKQLIKIVDYILSQYNHSISEIDLESVKSNAWEYSHNKIEYEKSLAYLFPDIVEEWHKTLNGKATPDKVTAGSSITRYWQCPNCQYGKDGEWVTTPNSRTSYKSGCPNCGYNWFDGKMHQLHKAVTGINDIATKCPELAREVHKTLNNGLSPSEISYARNEEIYWQCQNCGYGKNGEWIAAPAGRTAKGRKTGCPCCGYNWFDGKIHAAKSKMITGINDIDSQYPKLAEEWHKTLNGEATPDKVAAGSSIKRYWQCPNCEYGKGGEWIASPNGRTHKGHESGCPCCGYNWHRAQTGQPQKYKGVYKHRQNITDKQA